MGHEVRQKGDELLEGVPVRRLAQHFPSVCIERRIHLVFHEHHIVYKRVVQSTSDESGQSKLKGRTQRGNTTSRR